MTIKLLILGSTGLLGNKVSDYFTHNSAYEVVGTYRNSSVPHPKNSVKFDAESDSLEILPHDFDYAINCIGIIKPFMYDQMRAIEINSLFPWELANWCNKYGIKMIHITTDCVYSGKKGEYVESDLHDALDAYGKTKSLGECVDKAMILRTSIIGEEVHKNASLVEWAKSQKGKTVNGFTTHLWNGVTTTEFAKVCDRIMTRGLYVTGLYHIFAKDDVSKYQMLHYFNDKFDLHLTINEDKTEPVNRTMRTEKDLCAKLGIPTVEQMIQEM